VKIDKRFASLINAILMAIILPFFMTLVVSVANIGLTDRLFGAWMRTWAIASVVAFPLILILAPLIKRIVGRITV
jgi:Protein of unknown function (DUF2798).